MNQRKKAFTLIELLVVISIIAVLLSVLMPALNKAKYVAKRIVCMNNMKSQGLTFFTYASDYGGKYPAHNSPLAYYMTYGNFTIDGNPWSALKDTYMTNSQILICPVNVRFGGMFSSTEFITPDGDYGGWDTPTATYIRTPYNWYANHTPPNSNGDMRFRRGERPWPEDIEEGSSSHVIIAHTVMQLPWGFYDYTHGGSGEAAGPATMASSKIVDNPVVHADGSVTYRKKADMLTPSVDFTNDVYGLTEYYY